jgi:hypothetical protein
MWNKTILLLKAGSMKKQNESKRRINYKIWDYGTKRDNQGNKYSTEEQIESKYKTKL